ncbi:MAG: hypothetical protein IKV94_02000 [Clostridia bacterium]|nr:hypothetical protein [Clostridia bacterium]
MTKFCIIDFRMREVEKEYIRSLGYELIENRFNLEVYDEISAHPDIYYTKVADKVFCDPNRYIENSNMVSGVSIVGPTYPTDIPYNLAVVGKNAVHNFKYTDGILKTFLEKAGYNLIQVEQGYTKCSTCVLTDNSCIVSDIAIARELLNAGVDVLFVSEPDIKLLERTNKIFIEQSKMRFMPSEMNGFIGGALVVLGDTAILFGDVNKLINGKKIKTFIESKGLKFKWFEGLDVIDYGGVIEVEKYE